MRKGRPRPHPPIRLDHTDRALATRQLIGAYVRRHPNLVLRYCTPVACDVATRQLLYDLDDAQRVLSRIPTRRVA